MPRMCFLLTSAIVAMLVINSNAKGCDPGDVNCDGVVNARDIQSFVRLLTGSQAPCAPCAGDLDGSGGVTGADIDALIAGLLGRHSARVQNGCLVIVGTPAGESLALRLAPGLPFLLQVDVGIDGVNEFTFDRSQFNCIRILTLSGDDIVFIDEANGIFTDTEITTIDGGSGNDTLLGGSGGETFIGGEGTDTVDPGAGDDRLVWKVGDGNDVIEGGVGIDTVEVTGDASAESFTITANGTRVRLDRLGPVPYFLDIGTCERLVLNAGAGNDSLTCTGNLAALIQITADGGPGDDTLSGSNGADVLIGGDDNDFVDGQQGNDTILLGAGNDSFQWDPGDGNDLVEGQAGHDTIIFNGAAVAEVFDLSANGSRLRFTRNIANIVLDADGIEQFDLRALGGADTTSVNNLSGTALAQVNIELASAIGGTAGDAQVDSVNIVGTADADTFDVDGDNGFVVTHWGADVRVMGREANDQMVFTGVGGDLVRVNGTAGPDTMTVTANGAQARVDVNGFSAGVGLSGALALAVRGLGGNDLMSCTGNLAAIVPITLDGGPGDDTLLGGNGADVLIGGDDNDFVDGQQGNDTILLGSGNDTFQWDPGDGNDVVEGQAGMDTIVFNGSAANEIVDLSANGSRLRFTRNIANIVLDADGIEQFDLRMLGGVDAVAVQNLAGTDLIQVFVNLSGTIGGTTGDAQPDSVTVNCTNQPDTVQITANAGGVDVSGLSASVRVTGADPTLDALTVNGLLGTDTITTGPGVSSLIILNVSE